MSAHVTVITSREHPHVAAFTTGEPHATRGRYIYAREDSRLGNQAAYDLLEILKAVEGVYDVALLRKDGFVISARSTAERDSVIGRVLDFQAIDLTVARSELSVTRREVTLREHRYLTRVAYPTGPQPSASPS